MLINNFKIIKKFIKNKKYYIVDNQFDQANHIYSIPLDQKSIFLLLAAFIFLIVKVFFLMYANPLPDEAYYWLWSKNIALSYFDHPPLATWLQAFLFFL